MLKQGFLSGDGGSKKARIICPPRISEKKLLNNIKNKRTLVMGKTLQKVVGGNSYGMWLMRQRVMNRSGIHYNRLCHLSMQGARLTSDRDSPEI